ncbi:hypothetical protein [Pseudacidovorax intermedius]|uniref:hypothetical protein n=1 Tax=Pseudacidovorax intermedius TaxID=433924 RepID=UPI00073487D8|nr:hypothetical protein [Pseudacidovorax intermedius]
MARSSLLGNADNTLPHDDDTTLLGPSDNSDSGSDTVGEDAFLARPEDSPGGPMLEPLGGATDASGTGERADVEGTVTPDADILPDRVIGPDDGMTDEDVRVAVGEMVDDEDTDDDGDGDEV